MILTGVLCEYLGAHCGFLKTKNTKIFHQEHNDEPIISLTK